MIDFRYVAPVRLGRGLDRLQRVDHEAHRSIHGALRRRPYRDLVALADAVDLRGRGGAAFPFARKLAATVRAARERGCRPVVLVNAAEGEPASAKDRFLLAHTPHLVLDGALLAATAMDAREVIVAVTDQDLAARSMHVAIGEAGLGGHVRMVHLPERFVTGEGGALVRGVNGGPALPPGRKVRAADRGVDGLPTLLSNAETFAQLAMVSALGAGGYGAVGTPAEPGTVLLTVWGPGGHPRVIETPTGIPLAQALDLGDARVGQGVLVGGYHGAWLTPEAANRSLVSRESIERAGGALGAGIVMSLPPDVCPLGEVARVAAYLGAESSGQCGPCRLGLPAIARSLSALASGRYGAEALTAIHQGTRTVQGRGACHHPDGAARFVTSALTVFAEDVETHLAEGTCARPVRGLLPAGDSAPVTHDRTRDQTGVRLTVDWTRCAGHGLCGHLARGLIRLDEHGFPVISEADVPRPLLRDARVAVEMCPALALRLGADQRAATKAAR